jgi:hypothetical protein
MSHPIGVADGMRLECVIPLSLESVESDGGATIGTKRTTLFATGQATRCYTWEADGLEACQTSWWKAQMKVATWDLIPGMDAVARAANASWFKWDDGSRPFHWRWREFYQKMIRDGTKVHFISKKPEFMRAQAENRCPKMMERMKLKLNKVRKRRCIAPGLVSSLTSFFAVPKGSDDIRMVCNASVSGLNDSIWVPRFPSPTSASC